MKKFNYVPVAKARARMNVNISKSLKAKITTIAREHNIAENMVVNSILSAALDTAAK